MELTLRELRDELHSHRAPADDGGAGEEPAREQEDDRGTGERRPDERRVGASEGGFGGDEAP